MVEWYFITHFFLLGFAVIGWVAAFKEHEKKMEWKSRYQDLQDKRMDEVKKAILTGAGSTAMNHLMEFVGVKSSDSEEIDLTENNDN